jgi:hypothetical protein
MNRALPQIQDAFPLKHLHEIQIRGGIPNLLRKARSADGRTVRVGYLGGSITDAPGWRVRSLQSFRERFPRVEWQEIHAAIGGTGSDLGVFRVGAHVLAHMPDLLFVEFAVNDHAADPVRIHRAIEGIVRQTWAANPETDIVFIYTVSQPALEALAAGMCSRSASAMEMLADHYGIPSIHFGAEVRRRLDAGTLVFKGVEPLKDAPPVEGSPMVFSADGVHPFLETGHALYGQSFARALDVLCKESASPGALPHDLGVPYRNDHWAAAKLVPLSRGMLSGNWTPVDARELGENFVRFLPGIWQANSPGAKLSFRFRGETVGFLDIMGPDGGQIRVQVDSTPERTVPRFDGYCTYMRMNSFLAATDLPTDALHSVTVTLDAGPLDKRGILFESNHPAHDQDPARFAPHVWKVGAILLIGEIAD